MLSQLPQSFRLVYSDPMKPKLSAKNSSYRLSADVLRTLAIMGVVAIHTSNAVFARPDFFGGISWWFALFVNSVSRISIPLFIMISGYFILQKNESFTHSIRRTFQRIIIPLIFWFLIMVIWNNGTLSMEFVNASLIRRLLTVNVFDLYFLVILAGLYTVAPVIRAFLKTQTNSQNIFMWFTLIAGAILVITQFLYDYCAQPLSLSFWLPYTGLFVAGYVLGREKLKTRRLFLVGVYLVSLSLTTAFGYFYFYFLNSGNTLLHAGSCLTHYGDYYLSINVILMTLCVFLLLFPLSFSSFPQITKKLVFLIARASLGIFILHTFVLDIFDSWFHLFDPISPAWLYLVVKWFVVFSVSFGFAAILINIPGIKRVFGETS